MVAASSAPASFCSPTAPWPTIKLAAAAALGHRTNPTHQIPTYLITNSIIALNTDPNGADDIAGRFLTPTYFYSDLITFTRALTISSAPTKAATLSTE